MICEVLGCTNRTSNRKKGISFHRFPYDEVLKHKWIDVLTRDGWSPNPLGRVCSIHFKSSEILKNPPAKALLVKTAVPSILPSLKYETSSQSNNETPSIPFIDVERWQTSTDNTLLEPIEKLNDSTSINTTTRETIRSKFSVISELANDMNAIKSKISQHLKTRRAKNCRMKTKIEKLKHFLIEIREETTSNNPVLEGLFENALEEPHYIEIYDQSNSHHSSDKGVLNVTSQQVELSETVFKEEIENSFTLYLTNELKKLHPEDLALIKRDIQNILESNTLVDDSL